MSAFWAGFRHSLNVGVFWFATPLAVLTLARQTVDEPALWLAGAVGVAAIWIVGPEGAGA